MHIDRARRLPRDRQNPYAAPARAPTSYNKLATQ
jgi:hypothetical protein